jgi:hypothetical protein
MGRTPEGKGCGDGRIAPRPSPGCLTGRAVRTKGDTQTIQITPDGFFGYTDQRGPNGAARGS